MGVSSYMKREHERQACAWGVIAITNTNRQQPTNNKQTTNEHRPARMGESERHLSLGRLRGCCCYWTLHSAVYKKDGDGGGVWFVLWWLL